MKGYFNKFTSVLLVLAMLVSMLVPTANASADLNNAMLIHPDKTATPLDNYDRTDVTLTVPGTPAGYIDIVFILGGGMTANMETIESAIKVFETAMKNGQAVVRMGLLSLEKGKEVILDLNSDEAILDPATYVDFVTEKFDSINDLPYGTTNLHSQMLEAQKMLDKETKAKAENKYVFVLATGRTYWFDDANGEQATVVNKVNGTYYWGNYLWQSQRGRHTSLYMIPDRYNDSYEAFFADIEKWVKADGDKYVYTPHFDVNDYSAYVTWEQANNKDLKALGVASSRFGNGIVNPVPTNENFITGTAAGGSSSTNPSMALNYERAQYECVQVWKQMIASGYNCYSICSENPNYQNGSEYIKQGAKYTGTSTIQVGHAFMDYLAKLAGQGTAPVVWDYGRDADGNITSTSPVLQENFFDSVRDDMLYTCSTGTTVEDFIGKNENGNFEFIESADCINLVVGGVDYDTALVEDTAAGSSYTFTAPGATEPTFWLDYYYGDGETTERFVWTFGETVSTDRLAHLTYKLQLTEKQEEAGKYIVPTNNSATLYPVDSDGISGNPILFPVPTVDYIVEDNSVISIYGTKTWVDNNNADNKRPEFITIHLWDGDFKLATAYVYANKNGEWKYVFHNLPEYRNGVEIVYTITEDPVDNYTTVINGYNVTNVYVPETVTISGTKTWNDADDQDGKRPASITINLLANGTEVAEATVSAETAWQYTFNNLPKYENGVEIVYSITEDAVDGYTATIDGFNVTNTYAPETTTVSGTKTWNDADDQDGKRPASITINLLANGTEVAEATVTAETAWQYTFNNLPKYENGVEIVYTITEDAVDGYTATIDGYNVTNTYAPETTTVSGIKTWNDADDQDGKRPASITINLLANGTEVAEATVTAETAWQYTFNNLPKYENGVEIVYTITEDAVDGYTATIDGYNVTNTYAPENIQVSVIKIWEDEDNIDNTRPESITIVLYANGVAVEIKELSALDNWEWTFTDLAKYENGAEIVYTISEVEVEGYFPTVTGDMTTGFVITNTYLIEITDNPPPLTPPQTGDAALPVFICAIVALFLAVWIPSKIRQVED